MIGVPASINNTKTPDAHFGHNIVITARTPSSFVSLGSLALYHPPPHLLSRTHLPNDHP